MTVVERPELSALTETEYGRRSPFSGAPTGPLASAPGLWRRRCWVFLLVVGVAWSLWDATIGRDRVINPGGWSQVRGFLTASWSPELDGEFLGVVARSAATTAGYALVGTGLALLLGVVGGVLMSEVWWAIDPLKRSRRRTKNGYPLARLLAVLPRGLHEAIWALGFVYVLGRNPLVAVLAIALPFGAITAKVVAELIDDRTRESVVALRAAGVGRISAIVYGVAPLIIGDVISYGFYRLECSVRSSAVLGAIGAGGLGFQLTVSFQSLRYREIWTLIYALILLSAAADWWGASLRRRPTMRRRWISAGLAAAMTLVAAVRLGLRPTSLVDDRARRLAADLVSQAWPPRLPQGGWRALATAARDTMQLSVIAIAVAVLIASPLAFLAARPDRPRTPAWWRSLLVRGALLTTRSIPPTVWALMILFVVFPGPFAGGLALGCYTAGVIGRLGAEIVENADAAPAAVLRRAGVSSTAAFAYGTVPTVAPRFASLAMYRWEVAARETVIVGLVGAGGLGRLLAQQTAAFDEAGMLTTVLGLVFVSLLIDMLSSRVRAALR